MKKPDLIEQLMEAVILLLRSNYENDWSLSLEKSLNKYRYSSSKIDVVRKILGIFGGMGSFNDLVLMRNHKIPIGVPLEQIMTQEERKMINNANEELSKLRSALFQACIDYVCDSYGSPDK